MKTTLRYCDRCNRRNFHEDRNCSWCNARLKTRGEMIMGWVIGITSVAVLLSLIWMGSQITWQI